MVQSMEKNIGDQLKKAFEAYRQACLEKDNAKRELQQKTEYYQNYTQQLEQQIEDQNKLITKLTALLSSETKLTSDEASQKSPALHKQEVESLSCCDHHTEDLSCSQKMFPVREKMDTAEMVPYRLPGTGRLDNDVLDVFWELLGRFQLIQAFTQKQTNQLRKITRRTHTENEQQFSIPIQCTDASGERAEGPMGSVPATVRSREEEEEEEDEEEEECSGTRHEEGCLPDALTALSVRFPPSADSEWEFLNSASGREMGAMAGVSMATEEPSLRMSVPVPVPPAVSASSSFTPEGIGGPQQLRWSPDDPFETTAQGPDRRKCEFCNALVPLAHIYSHLNSHFQSLTTNRH